HDGALTAVLQIGPLADVGESKLLLGGAEEGLLDADPDTAPLQSRLAHPGLGAFDRHPSDGADVQAPAAREDVISQLFTALLRHLRRYVMCLIAARHQRQATANHGEQSCELRPRHDSSSPRPKTSVSPWVGRRGRMKKLEIPRHFRGNGRVTTLARSPGMEVF